MALFDPGILLLWLNSLTAFFVGLLYLLAEFVFRLSLLAPLPSLLAPFYHCRLAKFDDEDVTCN